MKPKTYFVCFQGIEDCTFDKIFMTKVLAMEGHDLLFFAPSVDSPTLWRKDVVMGTALECLAAKVVSLLPRILDGRVSSFRVLPLRTDGDEALASDRYCSSWDLGASPPKASNFGVLISLTLNPTGCSRRVERGPESGDESEMAAFRDLWGPELCSNRRFQDGTIVEAIVWQVEIVDIDF